MKCFFAIFIFLSIIIHVAENRKDKQPNQIQDDMSNISLLDEKNGIKIEGICHEHLSFSFFPYYSFFFSTEKSKLQIENLDNVDSKRFITKFEQKCERGERFKFVASIEKEKIIFIWTIEKDNTTGDSENVETKTYISSKILDPLSSIQVHMSTKDRMTIQTKNYQLQQLTPEKCDDIRYTCMMNGKIDLEDCFICVSKALEIDNCMSYISETKVEEFEQNEQMKGEDEEDDTESVIEGNIGRIIRHMQTKYGIAPGTVSISDKVLSKRMEKLLVQHCKMLRGMDITGTKDRHIQGTYRDIYKNIKKIYDNHNVNDYFQIRNKLRNVAICIKNPQEWIRHRRGFIMPDLSENSVYIRKITDGDIIEDEFLDKEKRLSEKVIDIFDLHEDVNIHGQDTIDESSIPVVKSAYFNKNKYCTEEYCNRWNDKTSCFSKIDAEDQGECGLCWVFASMLHLETMRCMRGYGLFKGSILYVANCNEKERELLCSGGNTFQFLNIATSKNFIPLETDYPYSYSDVTGVCPSIQNSWTNIWGRNTRVLNGIFGTGFISYGVDIHLSQDYYRDRLDTFINIVKKEIQNKGSVIMIMKAYGVLGFELDGKNVLSLCPVGDPDHAMAIVGYGNYIDRNGQLSSYWIIRNSWGYYWGDEGTFKLDMYGPSDCKIYAIHSVFILKLDLGEIDLPIRRRTVRATSNSSDIETKMKNMSLGNSNPFEPANIFYNNYSETPYEKHKKLNLRTSKDSESTQIRIDNKKTAFVDVAYDDDTKDKDDSILDTENKNDNSKQLKIKHVILDITSNKVSSRTIVYDNQPDLNSVYSCSRVFGIKNSESDKQAECRKYCIENFHKCKNHYNPGYCLMNLRKKNDCFFCSL